MYRSTSRYESRSIPEKPSRSARSTWVEPQQNRLYASGLEEDDGGLPRDPYLAEDTRILDARDYQHKGSSGGTDLREAQRLAANFFSQYPSASTAPEPVYRDTGRLMRPLSPDVPIDRYPPRGLHRDRDVGVDRWSGRPNSETLFPSSRSQLLLDDWGEERVRVDNTRERDLYGVPASRWRKRDDVTRDDPDTDYSIRKEADYPLIQTAADLDGGLKVTKRLDWTGLLRPDGSTAFVEDDFGLDMPLSKRATSQTYQGGGLPNVDSYREGLEDELNREWSVYSRRGGGYYGTERFREVDVRKEPRVYIDERLPESDAYLLGRSFGSCGERGGGGREDWKLVQDTSAGQGQRVFDSERGREKWRFEDRDSRSPFYSSSRHSGGGSGSGTDRGKDFSDSLQFGKGGGGSHGPKRDFSHRASITNQDILAVYYGNQGPRSQASKFAPTRAYPHPGLSGHYTPPTSGRYRPRRSPRSPVCGRPRLHSSDVNLSRKGKKRWEKHTVEGSEGKRFKKETQSDRLYLMHNSRAKSEENEQEAEAGLGVAERGSEDTMEGNCKGEASEPALEDMQKTANAAVEGNDPPERIKGLWDNDDSWSDSEDEEKQAQMTWNGPPTNDAIGWGEPSRKEREHATFQALQSGAVNDSNKFLGECSEDDDADWEYLASDLDDQLDEVCVHEGLEGDDAITKNPDSEGVVPTNPEGQASEENGRVGTFSVAQSQDSEMVEIDNIERSEEGKKGVAEVDSSVEGVSVGIEKKKVVVIMEELQESVKNREDKAFDNYVSLFEQDTDLMKLYETNVNCGSFECLVCAGVGAKKKKRFPDVASLVQHAKKILRTKKLPEHRGFGRAVCKILGWETVPGPSVILPRVCIPQQSKPTGLKFATSKKQAGGAGSAVGMDWEWAAARQLFEEQEARIDLTTRSSGDLPPTDNSATSRHPSSRDGRNPESAQGPNDLEAVVETTMILQKTSSVDDISVSEKASVKFLAVPDKASLTEVVSEPVMVSAVTAVEAAEAEARSVLEKSEVAKAIPASATGVPAKTAVGESLSVTHNATLVRPSLVYEISTVAHDVEKDVELCSSETLTGAGSLLVEMWAPLPREEISENKTSHITVVGTKVVDGSGRETVTADVGAAALLCVEATRGNGVDVPGGESLGDSTEGNGEGVLHELDSL